MVFGIVPTTQFADAGAPFSDTVNGMSGGTWAGNLMAIAVIISGFGALNGWAPIFPGNVRNGTDRRHET